MKKFLTPTPMSPSLPSPDLAYKDAIDLAKAMHDSKGHPTSTPRMVCSMLSDKPKSAKNLSEFADSIALVISVGGTNTWFRILETKRSRIIEHMDLVGTQIHGQKIIDRISTPCSNGKPHDFNEMIDPIAQNALPWLWHFLDKGKLPHILINWAFDQTPTPLSPSKGISGAVAGIMSKGQSLVKATGKEIDKELRSRLLTNSDYFKKEISLLKITIQNDTIVDMYRYLERYRRIQYRKMGLMILGTGLNFTTAEQYLVDQNNTLILDDNHLPIRWDHVKDDITKTKEMSWQYYWINYEIGHVPITHSRLPSDHLKPHETSTLIEDIENFGASGTGFPRIFTNLIEDTCDDSEIIIQKLKSAISSTKYQTFDAYIIDRIAKIDTLSKNHFLSKELLKAFPPEIIQKLKSLAKFVIQNSAFKSATVLAGASLFNGFGLHDGDKPDALAMEGSIWKSQGYPRLVKKYWGKILSKELQERNLREVNVDFIVEDNFNAGILGAAYLLGQFNEN